MTINREQTNKLINLLEEVKTELTNILVGLVNTEVNKEKEVIEFEGAKYQKVDRKVREGDVVIYHTGHESTLPNKPYKAVLVDGLVCYKNESGLYKYSCHGWGGKSQYNTYELIQEEKTPNQQRAEIIEKAKKFIELDQYRDSYSYLSIKDSRGDRFFDWKVKNIKFIVNENKGRVVLLVIGDRNDVVDRFYAKCAPDDVFNEHIGKAIALGRALGIDVSEFEKAVQPSEVVVGHIINTKKDGIKRVVLTDIEVDTIKGTCALRSPMVKYFLKSIINDTNATYSNPKEGK